MKLFVFLGLNVEEEFRLDKYILPDGSEKYLIGTQHSEQHVDRMDSQTDEVSEENWVANMHNHFVNGTTGPSDTGDQGDLQETKKNPSLNYYVFVPDGRGNYTIYQYGFRDGKPFVQIVNNF